MDITIFLGRKFVADENTADKLVNKILLPQVQALRAKLKNELSINMPIINVQDDIKLLDTEIMIQINENIVWKENFSKIDYDKIVNSIMSNLEQSQLNSTAV